MTKHEARAACTALAEKLFLVMVQHEWPRDDAKSANDLAERAFDMAEAFYGEWQDIQEQLAAQDAAGV